MDYEKKYKEAMEKAKSLCVLPTDKGILEYIFPELAESEDERIIKNLQTCLHCGKTHGMVNDDEYLVCKNYLEKQKEQKVDVDKLRRDIYQSGYNDGYQHGKEDAQKEQKPAEWSEEDKRMTNGVYDCQRVKLDSFHPIIQEFSDMLEDKPKPYWDGWYEALDYIRKKGNPFENQKPKTSMWHKADRAMLDCIIATFCEEVHGGRDTNERFITWLKALPQRFNIMQHKWDRKDAKLCRAVISTIEYCKETYRDSPASVAAYDEESQWLKSLPERFNLQPKQEWGKEDEKRFLSCLGRLQTEDGTPTINLTWFEEHCDKPSSWKPSEEQMGSLRLAIDSAKKANLTATVDTLTELYEQLKKL